MVFFNFFKSFSRFYEDPRPDIKSDGGGSTAYLHVSENERFVTDVQTSDNKSTEANGRLSYYISGGKDAHLFEVDRRSGKVYFKDAPNFEKPLDYGSDNKYEVKVKVFDAAGYSDSQLLKISVKDVVEDSKISGTAGDDSIFGDAGNNRIYGFGGNDFINALAGDDIISGGAGSDVIVAGIGNDVVNGTDSVARGINEIDVLNGNEGIDTFILGDSNGSFYLGNNFGDFAIIDDFVAGQDQIVLHGVASEYSIVDNADGTAAVILCNDKGGGVDAVASLTGQTAANLDINQFQFV